MTCKGYDSKAVKVNKSIKRLAAKYANPHQRGAFIKSYVRILEDSGHQRSRKTES